MANTSADRAPPGTVRVVWEDAIPELHAVAEQGAA
jgi:hypothetical protein